MLPADTYASLGELLSDALVQWKRELALLEVDRKKVKRSMSYLDVHREAARVAAYLATKASEHGARREAVVRGAAPTGLRVAVALSNQSRWLVAACAAFRVGAVLVPIDYKLSAEEQLELLAHSGATLLVTEVPLLKRFAKRPPCHVLLVDGATTDGTDAVTIWDALPEAAMPALARRTREDVAAIVYSSGTGGRPKGCMLLARCLPRAARRAASSCSTRCGRGTGPSRSCRPTTRSTSWSGSWGRSRAARRSCTSARCGPSSCGRPRCRSYAITHMAVVPAAPRGTFEKAGRRASSTSAADAGSGARSTLLQ
jgi:acyl-CoA synthetase (AMP-forming)/AMP-acid ligase II